MTEEELDSQIEQAKANWIKAHFATEPPCADSAEHHRRSGMLEIVLKRGKAYHFPVQFLQGLSEASPEEADAFCLGSSGGSIHWDKLDVDFSIPGLIAGRFGTAEWMDSLKENSTRDPLLALKLKLMELQIEDSDEAQSHQDADSALLAYINDRQSSVLFDSIDKWYS